MVYKTPFEKQNDEDKVKTTGNFWVAPDNWAKTYQAIGRSGGWAKHWEDLKALLTKK